VLGAALGIAIETGAALLLFTTRGFLGSAGFIVGVSLAALGLGLWVGAEPAPRWRRWLWVILAFTAAGIFTAFWRSIGDQQQPAGIAGALAVLLVLAEPAYTSGALFNTLAERQHGVAAPAFFGAAAGILLAALILIPRLPPSVIFVGAAIILAATALWDLSKSRSISEMHSLPALTHKVALITGVGNRGQVGYALAEHFIAAGARVCVTDVTANVVELARELGADALAVQADLTDGAAVEQLIERVRAEFGRLDVVVNAAGGLSVIKPLAETQANEWQRELQRNAETGLNVTRAALPLLRERGGSVINFASPAALRAQASLGAYSAAKAAVVALTRALAIEEKQHGVRVNALAPGMIDTEQNRRSVPDPENVKWVSREQIAGVVLFLASDAASGITGETIQVLGESIS
jgi:3-oxoacyl-[acyl-carrier protein] reductase/2-deoxy-D-gluconate 3-dehydrogenase